MVEKLNIRKFFEVEFFTTRADARLREGNIYVTASSEEFAIVEADKIDWFRKGDYKISSATEISRDEYEAGRTRNMKLFQEGGDKKYFKVTVRTVNADRGKNGEGCLYIMATTISEAMDRARKIPGVDGRMGSVLDASEVSRKEYEEGRARNKENGFMRDAPKLSKRINCFQQARTRS